MNTKDFITLKDKYTRNGMLSVFEYYAKETWLQFD